MLEKISHLCSKTSSDYILKVINIFIPSVLGNHRWLHGRQYCLGTFPRLSANREHQFDMFASLLKVFKGMKEEFQLLLTISW